MLYNAENRKDRPHPGDGQEAMARYQEDLIANAQLVNQCLERISIEPDFDRAVNWILAKIGQNAHADRCYIYCYREVNSPIADCKYEWCSPNVKPEIDSQQNLDMSIFPELQNALESEQDFIANDINDFDTVIRDHLHAQNILSLLISPLLTQQRKLFGYIGIDFVKAPHFFHASDIQTIHDASRLIEIAHERKLQTDALVKSMTLQKQIFDNVNIPLLLFSPEGVIQMTNRFANEVLGKTSESLCGKLCYKEVCGFQEPPDWCPLKKTCADYNSHQVEFYQRNGKTYFVTTQPIFDQYKKLIYVLESAVDITYLKEQQLLLEKAAVKAQEAVKAKSTFLATMSHEIRTPLNAIIGFSELLNGPALAADEQKDYVNDINIAGKALLGLINDVLDLSKIEAEQLVLQPVPVDIKQLFSDLNSVFKQIILSKGLYLHFVGAEALPTIMIDELRLRQILLNLIGNALKFSNTGGVTVQATYANGTFSVSVTDTGIGVIPEKQQEIFEPFCQQDPYRDSHVFKGTGLGLAICRTLAAKMNGQLELQSEVGKGSVFTLTVHAVASQPKVVKIVSRDTCLHTEYSNDLKILVVDDVPVNLKMFSAMLRSFGLGATTATSAEEALAFLQNNSYDLLLTDLWMPEMNGDELVQTLCQQNLVGSMKTVLVTADITPSPEQRSIFDDVIMKPVTRHKLQKLFKRLGLKTRV